MNLLLRLGVIELRCCLINTDINDCGYVFGPHQYGQSKQDVARAFRQASAIFLSGWEITHSMIAPFFPHNFMRIRKSPGDFGVEKISIA